MEDALMLFDGTVVYFSEVSNQKKFDAANLDKNLLFFGEYYYSDYYGNYSRIGRIRRFKSGFEDRYKPLMAIFDIDTGRFKGYYSEARFWDNNNHVNKRDNETFAHMSDLGLPYFPPGIRMFAIDEDTRVYFIYKDIIITDKVYVGIKYGFILYKDLLMTNSLDNVLNEGLYHVEVESPLSFYCTFIINKQLLSPNGTLVDFDNYSQPVLSDIVYILDSLIGDDNLRQYLINNNLYEPFENHITIYNKYGSIPPGIIHKKYHNLYTIDYFNTFRLKLVEFYYWSINYKDDYTDIIIDELVIYIVNLFDPSELSSLSYDFKINLLYKILANNKYWLKGDWLFNSLNEEEAVVKIISSIYSENNGELNYADINKFMDLLSFPPMFDVSEKRTLYQYLYDCIDDTSFLNDDGNGNRGKFVKTIYLLWKNSKYNPLSVVNQNILVDYHYTPYDAKWEFDNNIQNPKFDNFAAPLLINYESEKFLLWYNDNYKFEFKGDKIVALQQCELNYSDYIWRIVTWNIFPSQTLKKKYAMYGTYDVFQPVSVITTDKNDTIIRMPVETDNFDNPCENNASVNNNIPIFYLKYLDDLGDYSDAKSTIGVVVDVLLTFTGVGNLAKLKHIKNFSIFRRAIQQEVIYEFEKIAVMRALRSGLFASWEILISTASLVHSLKTDNCTNFNPCEGVPPEQGTEDYEKMQRCKAIEGWLFALELLTLSGDLLAKRYFQRQTGKILEHLPQNFDSAARVVLEGIADIDHSFNEFYDALSTNIKTKLTNLNLPTNKKHEFFFEFNSRPDVLDLMDGNTSLIDNWSDLFDKKLFREINDIDFLKNQLRVDDILKFYNDINLKPFLEAFSYEKRLKFLDEFADLPTNEFNKFVNNHQLINYWDKFYKNKFIQKEFSAMSKSGKLNFLETFGDIDNDLFEKIRKNKDFFKHWDDLTDAQRAAKNRLKHFEDFYDDKLDNLVENHFNTPDFMEPTGSAKSKKELRSWFDTEIEFECHLISSGRWPNGKKMPGDAIFATGKFKGKFVDWTSFSKGVTSSPEFIADYANNLNRFKKSIVKHLKKTITPPPETEGLLDIYMMDMKYFTPQLKNDIYDFLENGLSVDLKKIVDSDRFIILNP